MFIVKTVATKNCLGHNIKENIHNIHNKWTRNKEPIANKYILYRKTKFFDCGKTRFDNIFQYTFAYRNCQKGERGKQDIILKI